MIQLEQLRTRYRLASTITKIRFIGGLMLAAPFVATILVFLFTLISHAPLVALSVCAAAAYIIASVLMLTYKL